MGVENVTRSETDTFDITSFDPHYLVGPELPATAIANVSEFYFDVNSKNEKQELEAGLASGKVKDTDDLWKNSEWGHNNALYYKTATDFKAMADGKLKLTDIPAPEQGLVHGWVEAARLALIREEKETGKAQDIRGIESWESKLNA
ncbi:MAG: hypothetical protein NT141_00735 [candidate division WWE3 bacterium]|nr:hypothetical protein [candidate division WWE3 bacterium]